MVSGSTQKGGGYYDAVLSGSISCHSDPVQACGHARDTAADREMVLTSFCETVSN